MSLTMAEAAKRYAVVTGANRGIGLEICRQLCANRVTVVLTARDEKRGVKALENLKGSGLSNVVFHQLDIVDPASVASLADFIKTQFGRLDILVNNAGIMGMIITDPDALISGMAEGEAGIAKVNWKKIMTQNYELSEECISINYHGTKRVTDAFIPLLQLSDSPRIVNVSSSLGNLKNIPNEWARGVLNDAESLKAESVEEVLNQFLKDYKEGLLEAKNWPTFFSAYTLAKAALNSYARIQAKKYPTFCINCVCPGYVKTDMNYHTGISTVEEGAQGPVMLALLPNDGPSGQFFSQKELSSFD